MPGPAELPAQQPAPIIGREAGLARLRALATQSRPPGQVLVVTGEAGMGKTVLLADAAERARSAGMRVLSVTGRESESRLAFAGLHQLLRPVLSSAAGLPGRQAQALLGALGLAADPVAPDPLLTGVAVLTLLSDLAERSPVLVVADDAHWLDRSSLDALAFAGSRLDAEQIVLLVGARGQAPPPGFDRGFPELHLEPLSAADAGLLLDGQPRPPRGRARLQVLAQAAGNPMALIELAKVIADDPAASRRWAAEPLPLTDRLSAVLTSRFATLPEQTQAALLLAAVADGPDLRAAASHGAGPDALALTPAEQLGLIKIDRTGLRFSHPLVRSAIYHSAPFAQRAAAHRQLAEALHDQPDRRAWHLAAAALHPDEQVASLLEATAAQAQRRGGAAAAALAHGTRGRTQPRPRRPGTEAGRRRFGRRSHRPGRLGAGARHPRPGGHGGPGTAADRPPRRRVGAGLVRPAHCRAVSTHLRRRRGIARPAGPRLGRARERSHRRLPVRHARQPPGRQPHPRPAGTPGSAAPRPGPGHRCPRAQTVDTRQRRPDRQQKPAPPALAQDRRLAR